MIPFVEQPSVSIGPLQVHAFGVIVATAVFVGMSVGARRFRRSGLDAVVGERFAWSVVLGGFLGAHLFAVIFYFPEKIADNPLVLLKLWEDISSFGGILGGVVGMWIFFRFRAPSISPAARWAFVDVAAFVFPVSLMIGRIACALAHDHPGSVTDCPLAVSLESPEAQVYIRSVYATAGLLPELPSLEVLADLGFHDLGWYEFLYLAAVVVPVMLLLGRIPRRPGTFFRAFVVLYMPVRFGLDFLRIADIEYAGLTPAQWVAVTALLLVLFTWRRVLAWPDDPAGSPSEPALASQRHWT